MNEEEYAAAVQQQQQQEQYVRESQEQHDANEYVQDLIEKTSKVSDSGMEEEEYGEEEEE